jgi:hypothetical protein
MDLDKIATVLKNFLNILRKAASNNLELDFDLTSETNSVSVEISEKGSCTKVKVTSREYSIKFHIGLLVKKGEDKIGLFLSFDLAHMLLHYQCLLELPFCSAKEPGNAEAEEWFIVAEPYNEEFFNEETTETRKVEIITQILSGVVENLVDSERDGNANEKTDA